MIRRIAIAAAFLLCFHAQAFATAYFSVIDDLPIPDGMTEMADESVVFDSPSGKIVTAAAEGKTTVAAVRAYYRTALPPLGWTQRTGDGAGGDRFVRDGQTLTLDYIADGNKVTVRVRLLPSGAQK